MIAHVLYQNKRENLKINPALFPTLSRNKGKIPFVRLNKIYPQFFKNPFLCARLHKRPVAFLFLWGIIDDSVRPTVVIRSRKGISGSVVPLPEAVFVQ